jgi:hypothetical protein
LQPFWMRWNAAIASEIIGRIHQNLPEMPNLTTT